MCTPKVFFSFVFHWCAVNIFMAQNATVTRNPDSMANQCTKRVSSGSQGKAWWQCSIQSDKQQGARGLWMTHRDEEVGNYYIHIFHLKIFFIHFPKNAFFWFPPAFISCISPPIPSFLLLFLYSFNSLPKEVRECAEIARKCPVRICVHLRGFTVPHFSAAAADIFRNFFAEVLCRPSSLRHVFPTSFFFGKKVTQIFRWSFLH